MRNLLLELAAGRARCGSSLESGRGREQLTLDEKELTLCDSVWAARPPLTDKTAT
jgi:hypothetical protein